MSFILDALKKSDKKRQESTAPGLDTVHDSAPIKSPSRQLWVYGLIAILLLNVGLLSWFFSSEGQAPVAEVTPVQQQSVVAVAKPEPVAKPQPQPVAVPQEEPVATLQTKPVAVQQAEPVTTSQAKPVEQPLPKLATPEPPVQQLTPEPVNSQAGRRVYSISELPASVQQQIPELRMSLHAYSDTGGSAGMIRVNEHILRQGSTLEGKILLEEIRADGAVFSFDSYHFLLPLR